MKSVTILGFATDDFPVSGEIWSVNDGHKVFDWGGKIDKLFIMHLQVKKKNGQYYFNWEELQEYKDKYKFEVIALHDIPVTHTPYPYKEIKDEFKTEYFASTFCYMVAYAMLHGYERINLAGMNFYHGVSDIADDMWERCGLEYWAGRAEQSGIGVRVLGGDLLQTREGKPYAIDG